MFWISKTECCNGCSHFVKRYSGSFKHYLPGTDNKLAKDVADFLEIIHNWFTITNTYSPVAMIPSMQPFGQDLDIQTDLLNNVSDMMCVSLQTFQKGVIISIKPLQDLYAHIKSKYGVQYISTHRLNQDCLENLFSLIRTRGGLHDHPSPLNALYRLRMILLRKKSRSCAEKYQCSYRRESGLYTFKCSKETKNSGIENY